MVRLAVLLSILLSFGAHGALPVGTLECRRLPGETLCRSLRSLGNLLQPCTGNSCYFLWNAQSHHLNRIADVFFAESTINTRVSEPLGRLAHSTAQRLCRHKWTGDPIRVEEITQSANRALKAMRFLQQAAGVFPSFSCEIQNTDEEQRIASF